MRRTTWARCLFGGLVALHVMEASARGSGIEREALAPNLERALRERQQESDLRQTSLYVAKLGTDTPWLSWNADVPVRPGAAARLLVAAAALQAWGPAESMDVTVELAPSTVVVGGVAQGDVFLRTEGDPTLTVARLHDLAWRLRSAGVDAVSGDVVLDGTLHDDPPSLPGLPLRMTAPWPPWDQTLGAWVLEGGRYGVSALPGLRPGQPVQIVASVPSGSWLRVDNQAATLDEGGQSRLLWDRADDEQGVALRVRGGIAVGESAWRMGWPVTDPGPYAAAVVAEVLAAQGIRVSGTVRVGEAPPADARVLVRMASAPLLSLLATMQRDGSDTMAESLLRTLGAKEAGEGTTAAGLAVLRRLLDDCLTDQDVLDAGSALSERNRIAASTLGCVVARETRRVSTGREWNALLGHPERGDAWVDALGVDGWALRGRGEEVDGVGSFVGLAQAATGERHVVVWLTEGNR